MEGVNPSESRRSSNWGVYKDVFALQPSRRIVKAWERAPVAAHAPRLQGQTIWKKLGVRVQQDRENDNDAQSELENGGVGARKKPRVVDAKETMADAVWQDLLAAKPVVPSGPEGQDVAESLRVENSSPWFANNSDTIQFIPRKRTNANHVITPRKPLRQTSLNIQLQTEPVVKISRSPAEKPARRRKSIRKSIRRSCFTETSQQAASGVFEKPTVAKTTEEDTQEIAEDCCGLSEASVPATEESQQRETRGVVQSVQTFSLASENQMSREPHPLPLDLVEVSGLVLSPTSPPPISVLQTVDASSEPVRLIDTAKTREKVNKRRSLRRSVRNSTKNIHASSTHSEDFNAPRKSPEVTPGDLATYSSVLIDSEPGLGDNLLVTTTDEGLKATRTSDTLYMVGLSVAKEVAAQTISHPVIEAPVSNSGHHMEATGTSVHVEDSEEVVKHELVGERRGVPSEYMVLSSSQPENLILRSSPLKEIANDESLRELLPQSAVELEVELVDPPLVDAPLTLSLSPFGFAPTIDTGLTETDLKSDDQHTEVEAALDTHSISTPDPAALPNDTMNESAGDADDIFKPDPTAIEIVDTISQDTLPAAYDHDDTDMLRNFLTRVKANKAAKAGKNPPKRKKSLPHSPLRLPLGDGDTEISPSPQRSKDEFDVSVTSVSPSKNRKLNDPTMDEEDTTEPKSIRRSGRTRLPVKAAPGAPSFIPVRRLGQDGDTTMTLRRSEEKELAALTRVNTRKNKGGALSAPELLARKAEEKEDPVLRQRFLKDIFDQKAQKDKKERQGKKVAWAEELAQFQTTERRKLLRDGEQEKETEEALGGDKRSAVRVGIRSKIALGMAANGTPAPKRRTRERT